ncbi:MAG: serine/threonine protein kinase [Roseateles sp.]
MSADARDDDIHALPAGTRFGELEVLGTLGVGGFGIVYLARDHALQREVAIKEYMPSQFAQRDGRSQVSVRSASMKETFELGRRSFVNEARLLARFDHPSLLKVYRFWEANGTAYMAMPRLLGQNLREARKGQAVPPPEAWLRRVFDAVLDGLAALHAQQVWHRDVAPDNIFLPADGGPPILLDFGAARQAIGDRTQVFTAILKPSYAPIEQYAEAARLKQGPWTDFYALAAVMHELLTGRPPPPCTARAMGDELLPLAVPGYSPSFLAGLDWALRVPPHQRPQSASAWREVLAGRAAVPPPEAAPPRTVPPPAEPEPLDLAFPDTVQAPLEPEAPAAATAAPAPGGRAVIVGGALAALVLLGLFVMQVSGSKSPPVAPAPAAVLPTSLPASAVTLDSAASAVEAAPPPVTPAPALAASVPRPASAPSRREPVPRPVLTERAGEFRPVSRRPVQAASEPVAASAPAPAAPASPAQPASPSEACSHRMLLARAWCVDRQCERPLFFDHPECVRLREIRNSQGRVP